MLVACQIYSIPDCSRYTELPTRSSRPFNFSLHKRTGYRYQMKATIYGAVCQYYSIAA